MNATAVRHTLTLSVSFILLDNISLLAQQHNILINVCQQTTLKIWNVLVKIIPLLLITCLCHALPLPGFPQHCLPNATSAWLKLLIPFNFSECSMYVLFFPCYCQMWCVRLWQGSMGDKGQRWRVQRVLLGAKSRAGAGTLLTRTRHTMLRNWRFPSTP